MRAFLFTALLGVAASPSWGAPLPVAIPSTICISAGHRVDNPTACGFGGASASVVAAPVVALLAQTFSVAGGDNVQAFSSLLYSFEVVGGKLDNPVPVTFLAEPPGFVSSS